MSSIPYSRYLFGTVPWYSVLIVIGVIIAIILGCREERRKKLPKDTIIDLALWLLPSGIIGARLYYVLFSWNQFSNDPASVFRIWEGGIAIYGGIIGGLIALLVFCRKRHLPVLLLCDLIAPGLIFAQCIGRWGNWFNIEAFGLPVYRPELCFFPFALQVPADGYNWHLATFFYESFWDFIIFVFLVSFRHTILKRQGDVFFFYVFLYAAGRLIIEELRMDSLYATSSVRVSQLLSILLCLAVLFRYILCLHKYAGIPFLVRFLILPVSLSASIFVLSYTLSNSFIASWPVHLIVILLAAYALLMIISLSAVFILLHQEVRDANIVS